MPALFIKEQGAMVVKRGERIAITKNSKILLEIPLIHVDNIAIIGNVQVTTQVLTLLMDRGIDISFFSFSGKYLGHASADMSKNIFLRFSQYELYHDKDRRLQFAKTIVRNKINNQIAMIQNCRWENGYDWKSDVKRMKEVLQSLDKKKTSNEVLGVEGMCSNIYFGAYGQMFKCRIKFNGRNRRPPRDPINVILSLAYTFLTKEICAAMDVESFEMYLGFLHGIRYGRKSIALDIIEEFRQPVVDRLVLRLFNKGILSEYDFDDSGEQIILNNEGFEHFCKEYERWLHSNNFGDDWKSFNDILNFQINGLKNAIRKQEEYVPFAWKQRGEEAKHVICN